MAFRVLEKAGAIVDAVRAETGRDVSHVTYHLQQWGDRFRDDDEDD